jgi:hypothetical protein
MSQRNQSQDRIKKPEFLRYVIYDLLDEASEIRG